MPKTRWKVGEIILSVKVEVYAARSEKMRKRVEGISARVAARLRLLGFSARVLGFELESEIVEGE